MRSLSPSLAVRVSAAAALALVTVALAPAASPAPAAGWSRHLSDSAALTAGATITSATGASYAVAAVVGGKPVRWNPCAPLHWRANISRGPVGGLDVLKAAVASVAYATGTTWVYDGTTLSTPTTAWLPTSPTVNRPVLIGWTDGTASDLLSGRPLSVLGMTRTTWFGRVTSTGTVAATRGAVVALNRGDHLPLRGADSWSAVALHELGHVMGLAHPHDSGELMNATLPATLSSLQTGDRAGLRLLGRSSGCISF